MGLDIEEIRTEKIGNNRVKNIMVLESDFEDYYLFERLMDRVKVSIEEFIE